MMLTTTTTLSRGPKDDHRIGGNPDIVLQQEEGKEGSILGWFIGQVSENRLGLFMSFAYFAIGFSPITALALAIMGLIPLGISMLLFVVPSTVVGIALALRFPSYGKLALKGLVIGLVAVFL
jgi:hypothetical protein